MYILAQIIVILAFICLVSSVWCKKRKEVLVLQVIGACLVSLQYFMLQYLTGYGMTGAVINLVSVFRIMIMMKKKPSDNKFRYIVTAFLVIYTTMTAFTWNGIGSLFSYCTCITSSIGQFQSNTNCIRFICCVTCLFWGIYDVYIGALVALIGEVMIACSSILSIIIIGTNQEELIAWKEKR